MKTSISCDRQLASILRRVAGAFGMSLGEFVEHIAFRALCGQEPFADEERRLILKLFRLRGMDLETIAIERRLPGFTTAARVSTGEPLRSDQP
jgi:hypothetical protein